MKERFMEIYKRIKTIQVIDSHEHLTPDKESRNAVDLLCEYAGQYMGSDAISAGMMEEQYRTLMDKNRPVAERFAILKPYLPFLKYTGYGRCMKEGLYHCTKLNALDSENVEDASRLFSEFFRTQTLSEAMKACGVACSIVDWMPLEWKFDNTFYIQAYNPLFLILPESQNRIRKLEEFTDVRIRDFLTYQQACRKALERKVQEQGVKILKISLAYHRALVFPITPYAEAEAEYNRCMNNVIHYRDGLSSMLGFDQCLAFQNYMVHLFLQEAEKWNLTVQFHTGYLAGNGGITSDGNPMGMSPIFYQYPGVKFDLFHASYPYYMEAGALAKMYPNVYVNLCWTHILSPNTTIKALIEWIQMMPLNKIIGFGGDADSTLSIFGHLRIARENMAEALGELVEQHIIEEDQVEVIARQIFYENPKTVYGIA